MFDKALELIAASDKIGFAFAATALTVFVGQYYEAWPFILLHEHLGLVLFFGLFGCFLMLLRALRWILDHITSGFKWSHRWWINYRVLSRIDSLLPEEKAAVIWIANNPKAKLYGSFGDDPWENLLRHGFIFKTYSSFSKQPFVVNKQVYRNKDHLNSLVKTEMQQVLAEGTEPPWARATRRGRISI